MIPQSVRKVWRKYRLTRWTNKRRKHQIRTATIEDIPELLEVEATAWKGEEVALFGGDELRAQISKYPEGTLLAETGAGSQKRKIEAFGSFMRLSEDMFSRICWDPITWEEITTSGFIENHAPEGPYLYGIDLSVPPRAERMGIGNTIRAAVGAQVVRDGLLGIILESRLPKMHKVNQERRSRGQEPLDGRSYVELKDPRGKHFDPELRGYLETPFMGILDVKANFYQDPKSENWGALLFWPNPLYALHLGWIYKVPVIGSVLTNLAARLVRSFV